MPAFVTMHPIVHVLGVIFIIATFSVLLRHSKKWPVAVVGSSSCFSCRPFNFYILSVNATIPAPQWSGCGTLMSQLRRGPLHSRQCYDQVSSHLRRRLINSFAFSGQLRQSNSAKETSIWATCRLRHWLDHEDKVGDLVGPVTESTRDHMKRHNPFDVNCPRCHWIKNGDKWSESCGKVPAGRQTPLTGEYWCMPRQPRRGGQWALGCTVCALVNESNAPGTKKPSQTPGTSAKNKRALREFDTKWARHEVRTIPQPSTLNQHVRQTSTSVHWHISIGRVRTRLQQRTLRANARVMASSKGMCPSLGTGCPLSQRVGGSSPGLPPH